MVLVHLAREDSVAASKAYNELCGFCTPELAGAMHDILSAFDDEDAGVNEQTGIVVGNHYVGRFLVHFILVAGKKYEPSFEDL